MSFDEWKEYNVQELIDLKMLDKPLDGNHGGLHPKTSDYVSSGVPFIMANDIKNGNVDYEDCYFITEEQAKTLKKGFAKPGDVLLTHKATMGRTAIVDSTYPYIVLTPQVTYYRVLRGIYNKYLRYYFDSEYFQSILLNWSGSGSTRAYLGITNQLKLPVILPPLPVQKAIADTLTCLDDKIQLNNRINKTLEEMAQAIFKSWFVDFEPFQDGEFENSELGRIPKGWIVSEIGQICNCILGGTPSRKEQNYWNGCIPWINSGKVNEFRIIEPSEYITELGLNKSATTLLPAKTTVLAITGATLGQVSLLEISSCANQSVVGILENDKVPYEFIYPMICNKIQELINHQTGGAQQHINKGNVEKVKFVLPNQKALDYYRNTVSRLYQLISKNCFETKNLLDLRDVLLPKLISGELLVPIEEVQ